MTLALTLFLWLASVFLAGVLVATCVAGYLIWRERKEMP